MNLQFFKVLNLIGRNGWILFPPYEGYVIIRRMLGVGGAGSCAPGIS